MNIKLESKDKVVHDVVQQFDNRSAVGYAKYGKTLQDGQTSYLKDLGMYLKTLKKN